jgi:hypothetical protein
MKKSEILLEVASSYIQRGEDEAHMRELLEDACIAWNISNLDKKAQKEALRKLRSSFVGYEDWTNEDINSHMENINKLISQKNKKFPEERFFITSAHLKKHGNEITVEVASATPQ